MKRFNYGLVSIMAACCCLVAFTGSIASAEEKSELPSYYQGISRDSGGRVRSGWRPNVTKFERADPARNERTEAQQRLWDAYDGFIGPRVQAIQAVNVYRGLAGTETAGSTGQNQKAAGEVDSTDLPHVEKNGHLNSNIVVMFSMSWCRPCHKMYPIMEALREEGYLVYIYVCNTDEYRDLNLQAKFQVSAYPTFIFFDKGKEVKRAVGGARIEWYRKNLKTVKEQDAEKDDTDDPYDGI